MSNPSLRGLQAFEAIGRCGSVSAAAEDLGVSPGAVSQLVRNLEQCLGLTLLERRGRRVELSSWGRLYYREVAKGFQQLSHAANVLTRARNESGIVLSALSSVASRWVSRKIFDWQSLCPGSNVRILGQEQEPRLGAEEVDFRITYGRRSYAHEHGIVILQQRRQRHILTHFTVKFEMNTHGAEDFTAAGQQRFVQLEGRNAERQQTADFRVAIVYGGADSAARQHIRAGQTRRTRADDSNALIHFLHVA